MVLALERIDSKSSSLLSEGKMLRRTRAMLRSGLTVTEVTVISVPGTLCVCMRKRSLTSFWMSRLMRLILVLSILSVFLNYAYKVSQSSPHLPTLRGRSAKVRFIVSSLSHTNWMRVFYVNQCRCISYTRTLVSAQCSHLFG